MSDLEKRQKELIKRLQKMKNYQEVIEKETNDKLPKNKDG